MQQPPTTSTVALDSVHKVFDGVAALQGLSLVVPQGTITVLLGPNGAGKTTAIRLITGALTADAGTVATFGLSPASDGEQIRSRCGVVSAKPALYDRVSGMGNLRYSAALYGVPRRDINARAVAAAERFGIEHALGQMVGGYSTGMKTRLALARSVLHRPDLLLFDEPTSGLDPESAHAVLDLVRDITLDGTTVVMCTHLLAEAEGLADQIVILDSGTSLLQGSQRMLTQQLFPEAMVRFSAVDPAGLDHLRTAARVRAYTRDGSIASVEIDSADALPGLVDLLVRHGVRVTRVEPVEPTLEDLYFKIRTMYRDASRPDAPTVAAAR